MNLELLNNFIEIVSLFAVALPMFLVLAGLSDLLRSYNARRKTRS